MPIFTALNKTLNNMENEANYSKVWAVYELALCYFPYSTPHTAVNHLVAWINRCTPLQEALRDQGYKKSAKWLSPREVRMIVEYLGEP